jgi:hypothetical protein
VPRADGGMNMPQVAASLSLAIPMSALPPTADKPDTIVERAPSRGTRFGRTPGVVC